MRDKEGIAPRAARIVQEVSCIWCHRLHRAGNPLEFHPICPACAARYPGGSLGTKASHPLTDEMIDETVSRTSAGNYALGYMDGTAFLVFYVGRSDSDVNQQLHDWVGAPSRHKRVAPSYTHFAFRYAASAEVAFEKECRNYHVLGGSDGLDNERHPVPPLGRSWRCPVDGTRQGT